MTHDDLDRFLHAQADKYADALAELRAGRKQTHWMWYVFPQIAGLGQSAMARRYAIRSLAEARAYLAHPTLGPRLTACVEALQSLPDSLDVESVLGGIDAVKLRSSLTLFIQADAPPLFKAALDRWHAGRMDDATLRLLQA